MGYHLNKKAIFLTLGITLSSLIILSLAVVLLKVSTASENRLKETGLFETVQILTNSFQKAYGELIINNFNIDIKTTKSSIRLKQFIPKYSVVSIQENYEKFDDYIIKGDELYDYVRIRWSGLGFTRQTTTNFHHVEESNNTVYFFTRPLKLSYMYTYIDSDDGNFYSKLQNLQRPLIQGSGLEDAFLEDTPVIIILLDEEFLETNEKQTITVNISTIEEISDKERAGIGWNLKNSDTTTEEFSLKVVYSATDCNSGGCTCTGTPCTWTEENDASFTPSTGNVAEAIWLNGTEALSEDHYDPVIALTTITESTDFQYKKAIVIANFRTNITVDVSINLPYNKTLQSSVYSKDSYSYDAGNYKVTKWGKIRIWPY